MSNHVQYQQHMEEGDSAAWDHNWSAAIESYTKAVQAKPDDADAHINLGLALLNEGQLDRALKVYRRAHQLAPEDPAPLERVADVLERMGQLKEAAQQYIKVAEVYLTQKDLHKAVANWERATSLTQGLVSIHARLAQAYERLERNEEAIREYLMMAYNFKRSNEIDKSIKAVERALKLDNKHAQSLNAYRALKSGGEIVLPADYINRQRKQDEAYTTLDDGRADVGEANPLGPMGEAIDSALVMLAEEMMSGSLSESLMFVIQGMDAQRQDKLPQAIGAYQQAAKAGMRHPSLKMNLGALMVMSDQAKEALPQLMEAVNDKTLSSGALHALGLAYFKLKQHKEASSFLIQSLQAVDTSLAASQEEEKTLAGVYRSLLTALDGRSPDSLSLINERFIGLLSGKDWKQRIPETRRHLDETFKDEGGEGLVDFLVTGSDDLTTIVTTIDRYIRNNLYTLAMDEAHHAIEKSPYYLPVHVRMAEIMMKEGRIRQAIMKYNVIASSYMVREENDRAATILQEVLELAPLDVDIRLNLISLLESEDRTEEALENYIHLAESYQQLGDFDRASETFQASERLARRINATTDKIVRIKHFIADIHQLRLNTRGAQKIYEEVLEVDSTDEKALRSLVDIYYNQGNQVEAIKRLDVLLGLYAKEGKSIKLCRCWKNWCRLILMMLLCVSVLPRFIARRGRTKRLFNSLTRLGNFSLMLV
jgi:tetratricopeptide (TPR) repeat protein